MQRRVALKDILLGTGALFAVPAWANGWTKPLIRPGQPFLSVAQDELLAEVVETIVPTTDSPGAKVLGVHTFVQRMITDCYEKDVQSRFANGLDAITAAASESYGKPFAAGDATQRLAVLNRVATSSDANQKEFMKLIKSLTVQGYMSSEYVMTNFMHYVMAPGHYYGCVSMPAKTGK